MSVARYSFLSWARRGLGAQIKEHDPLGPANPARPARASVPITLDINGTPRVSKIVALQGPADVIAVDRRAIVRTDPRPNVTDFEPNYLVSIELYDEELPWRYTPARADANHRLRPWLALVVLADGEFERRSPSAIRVLDLGVLPPANQVWAWAHVHVNAHLAAPHELDTAVDANPDVAVARLLSPRRLAPNTPYTAFLVPTLESGRRAALGLDASGVDGMAPAWGDGQDELPTYYEWSFRTGPAGDMESLVRLLEPRSLDPRVGIRDVDVSRAGITNPGILGFEGALRTPETVPTVWPRSGETFPARIADLINTASNDPIVAPTFYGRWHAAAARMSAPTNAPWVEELNSDPRSRSAAALGTAVVQRNQERFAASAWQQLGAADSINRMLVLAQLARFTARSLHERHFTPLPDDKLLALTAPLHGRVRTGPATVRHAMRTSQLQAAVVDRSFRRLVRPRGPLAKRIYDGARPATLMARLNTGQVTAAAVPPAPARALTVDRVAATRIRVTPVVRSRAERVHRARFRFALHRLRAQLDLSSTIATRAPFRINDARTAVTSATDPSRSIAKRVLPRIEGVLDVATRPDPLETIMWAPRFDEPMYRPLAEMSPELVLPNVGLIPQNTVSLLETNNRFIESYMVGLNHEMGRELLWREFPTDQRATYFRMFWDTRDAAAVTPDIDPIVQWPRTSSLGQHARIAEGRLVLLVRSDLLKKYPTAVIYAVNAEWPPEGGKRRLGSVEMYPLFRADLEPDIVLLGFDLNVATARGSSRPTDGKPGWFFVIKQRPGEPRFGADIAPSGVVASWDDLAWTNIPPGPCIDVTQPLHDVTIPDSARWGATAADMASHLFQSPMLIAIHATEMLP